MFKYHHTSDSESYTTTHKGGSVLSVSTEQSNNLFNNTLNMLNNNDMDMLHLDFQEMLVICSTNAGLKCYLY